MKILFEVHSMSKKKECKTENEKIENENHKGVEKKVISIDTYGYLNREDYGLQPVLTSHYSNLIALSVTHRDVFIDFLQLPGLPNDDILEVRGVRIYTSHAAAKKLGQTILDTLIHADNDGEIEHLETLGKKS